MKKKAFRAALVAVLLLVLGFGGKALLAQIFSTHAGPVAHVFSLATSDPASYSNPSGALEPMPGTSLKFSLSQPSLLTINFASRGTVAPSGSQIIPIVFVGCE